MIMAEIYLITMYWKDNFIIYDDSIPQEDYYNSYTLSTKKTVEWLKKDGASRVMINYVNPSSSTEKQISIWKKRMKLIADKAGYIIKKEGDKFVLVR
jgi:hypothetical protein